jgi:uncharacterized protein
MSEKFPGVYIEDVSGATRTISGVATSITAFIGRALMGPVNQPTTINSYGDFERIFGGLWLESNLGYAVRDFYLNGGNQAIIVRLFHPTLTDEDHDAAALANIAKATLAWDSLMLEASSEGSWANGLAIRVDTQVDPNDPDAPNLFNLTVKNTRNDVVELFREVSTTPASPRFVKDVLTESSLVRVAGPGPNTAPTAHPDPPEGQDAFDPANSPATFTGVTCWGFASDGGYLNLDDFVGAGNEGAELGLYSLDKVDLFNLLCLPPYLGNGNVDGSLLKAAADYCQKRRAMLIIDPPSGWSDAGKAITGLATDIGINSSNAALYFPRLRQPNPLRDDELEDFAPCGAVAGVISRIDSTRGVWKSPAGQGATLSSESKPSLSMTGQESDKLNRLAINCLRQFPTTGCLVWGARTREGEDGLASEWKYISVRRTALFLEESLYRGSEWVIFEPNDETLWAQIRLSVNAFMLDLFRRGAFQGATPKEAYFVKCDYQTTTQNDIDSGVVNILVGFAPLERAEFVIIKLQQMAGRIA